MMSTVFYPDPAQWAALLKRPSADNPEPERQVRAILSSVKEDGDAALRSYAARFDGQVTDSFSVTAAEWAAADTLSDPLKAAIRTATDNIRKFHSAQMPREIIVETMPGIVCRSKPVPVEKVGLYIPGGTAPLFSTLLMLGVPAQIAGCREIVVCTPPGPDGNVAPAILYAARELGIGNVYKAGGAQAIAAMAYGTESIPQVYKIFGPGNAYVTCAKMLLQAEGIAIDMPAGPSEVAVLADDSCVPACVAADLLSQAEHGPDSQVLLVTDSREVIDAVLAELRLQLQTLSRAAFIRQSLTHSKAILVRSITEGITLVNQYAPEHLIIACRDEQAIADRVSNAGSVFIGQYTPESVGDYASGTNHTLPTSGYARAYSGVTTGSFMKTISFQQLTPAALEALAPAVIAMAEAEGLEAHAQAVRVRFSSGKTINNEHLSV